MYLKQLFILLLFALSSNADNPTDSLSSSDLTVKTAITKNADDQKSDLSKENQQNGEASGFSKARILKYVVPSAIGLAAIAVAVGVGFSIWSYCQKKMVVTTPDGRTVMDFASDDGGPAAADYATD